MILNIFASQFFLVPVLAFILSQLIKNIVFWWHDKRISTKWLFTDGGMPSSHSSTMGALTATIYLADGVSTAFFVALFVTLIVVRDAYGVRFETSKQARILNKLINKMHLRHEKHLKEFVGHTKTQAYVGLAFGVLIAALVHVLTK